MFKKFKKIILLLAVIIVSFVCVKAFAVPSPSKEFYVNDAGNQIEKFGMSLDVRYRQIIKGENAVQMPENGYQGDDIKELAQEFFEINGDKYINAQESERTKALVDYALPKNIKRMQTDMEKYKIIYDNWFYESKLHSEGKVAQVIDIMKEIFRDGSGRKERFGCVIAMSWGWPCLPVHSGSPLRMHRGISRMNERLWRMSLLMAA